MTEKVLVGLALLVVFVIIMLASCSTEAHAAGLPDGSTTMDDPEPKTVNVRLLVGVALVFVALLTIGVVISLIG